MFQKWPTITRKLQKMFGNCRKSCFSRNVCIFFARFCIFREIFGKFPQDPKNRGIRKNHVICENSGKPPLPLSRAGFAQKPVTAGPATADRATSYERCGGAGKTEADAGRDRGKAVGEHGACWGLVGRSREASRIGEQEEKLPKS